MRKRETTLREQEELSETVPLTYSLAVRAPDTLDAALQTPKVSLCAKVLPTAPETAEIEPLTLSVT
jgi:hypothetical protein